MKGLLTGRASAFFLLPFRGRPGTKPQEEKGRGAGKGLLLKRALPRDGIYSSAMSCCCCRYCWCSSSAKPTRLGLFLPSS